MLWFTGIFVGEASNGLTNGEELASRFVGYAIMLGLIFGGVAVWVPICEAFR